MARLARLLRVLLTLAFVLVDEDDNILGGTANPVQIAGTVTLEES